jgi:hypothetical protein
MARHFITLPQSNPNYRIGVTLLGVSYWFDIRWNEPDPARPAMTGAWFLDVYDVNLKPIWSGIKLVIGTYLGRACQQSPFTDGVLIVYDTSGKSLDAGFDDLGGRVQMIYLPQEDLLAELSRLGVT